MNIAVFGATGGTGRQIVEQALEAGNHVSALVRDPSRLPLTDPNLRVIQGNVLDDEPVAQTLQGADAVIISLGNTADNPDYVVSQGTSVILRAMKEKNVPRVVAVTSMGVGDSARQVPLALRLLMRSALKKPMEDKSRQEAMVKDSGLEWVIVRPGGLIDGPATGQYKSGMDPKIMASRVSRADVAAFVLQQLTDDTYLHQTPAIS